MRTGSGDPGSSASLQRIINKAQARRIVAAMLDGSGLKVKEQKNELVITNPRDPEKGRVYVEYASGYVSWVRPSWTHWGPLQGYQDEDAAGDIGADQIIEALTGREPGTGSVS